MKLNSIKIEREKWGANEGKYIAKIDVGDDKASIQMQVSPEISSIILSACIEEICRATDEASQEFKGRLLSAMPPLLGKANPQ